jgi:ATP-binding cassette subfamily C protein LapB
MNPDIEKTLRDKFTPHNNNGVNLLQDKFQKALEDNEIFEHNNTDEASSTPYQRVLDNIINHFGWDRNSPRVLTALPHLQAVCDEAQLLRVMHNLGLQVQAYEGALNSVAKTDYPIIGFMRDSIVLVFDKDSDGQYVCYDAIRDVYFRQHHDIRFKYAVSVSNDDDTLSEKIRDQNKSWFWTSARQLKSKLADIIAVSFCINALSLILPIYVMSVYNVVITSRSIDTLIGLFAALCILISFEIVLRRKRMHAIAYAGSRLVSAVSIETFSKILRLPYEMTTNAPVETQISRFKRFESLRDIFTGPLASAAFDLPFIVIFLAFIFYTGGALFLIPIALIVVLAVVCAFTLPQSQHLNERSSEYKNSLQKIQTEIFTKAETIQNLGTEKNWLDRYRTYAARAIKSKHQASTWQSLIQSIFQVCVMLAGLGTLVFGAVQVMRGDMQPGTLIAIMMVVWRILNPIQVIFLGFNKLLMTRDTIKQIDALMRIKQENHFDKSLPFARKIAGNVDIRGVFFTYAGAAEPSLFNISFAAPKGSMTVITGSTGAGKTTLLRLLSGLVQPRSGKILIDGVDLRQLDKGELRSSIASVPQQMRFIYGTLRQNMRLANTEATDSDIYQAFQKIGLVLDEDYFPNGLDTRIGRKGWHNMPMSLQQQLCIARGFLKTHAPIILLDEPGTFIDYESDLKLIETLKSLKGQATIIMASNRPSHIQLAEQACLLHAGNIVKIGKPHDILAATEAALSVA